MRFSFQVSQMTEIDELLKCTYKAIFRVSNETVFYIYTQICLIPPPLPFSSGMLAKAIKHSSFLTA